MLIIASQSTVDSLLLGRLIDITMSNQGKFLSLVFFFCLLHGAPNAQAAEKLRMSVSGSYNMIFLAAGVAHHKAFFKDEGLDAEIVVMNAPASLAALSNGDI